MDKVKRRISRPQWNGVRQAFSRLVLYDRLTKSDPKKWAAYLNAAQEVLYEQLAPLTKSEKKLVKHAIRTSRILEAESDADMLLFDLQISL